MVEREAGLPRAAGYCKHVAVAFQRIGPYHFARLSAAGRLIRLTALEMCQVDATYAWTPVTGTDGFRRITLFDDAGAAARSVRRTWEAVSSALSDADPDVVAIPGWSEAWAVRLMGTWSSLHPPAK